MHAMPRKNDFIHVCLQQLESYEAPHINTCWHLLLLLLTQPKAQKYKYSVVFIVQ